MKHTKGKWKAQGLHILSEEKRQIGQTYLMNFDHDKKGHLIEDTEGEANAKLMASAPEMVELLTLLGNTFKVMLSSNGSSLDRIMKQDLNDLGDRIQTLVKKATT